MTRKPVEVARFSELGDREPAYALVANVDLVVVRHGEDVSVLYGRCLHRGALMADGAVSGDDVICGVHGWDYRFETGVSAYNNEEVLKTFSAWVDEDRVWVDEQEIIAWERENPQAYNRDAYLGLYADHSGAPEEPHTKMIHHLARQGLSKWGHHGQVAAMGVPAPELPKWDDLLFVTAQLAKLPLLDDELVETSVKIGPRAQKPLDLELPIFVSDMSFGALSEEAKIALARGAELAGTAICSGEGGVLPEEQAESSRYFYEIASGRFGFSWDVLGRAQAFHFKCGQGAKTGTGGHLPGKKVQGKIAEVRGLEPGTPAVSPARFPDWDDLHFYRDFAAEARERTGGTPVGVKLSAQHIERDIEAALSIGVDYIILDGRGGGTGAAPLVLRDHISVPTIPALARARRTLDASGAKDVTLVITGGLRTPADFAKALALGADAIAISNSAIQAIGCIAMRACHTNKCPVGVATQDERLRSRLKIERSSRQLERFLRSSVELMTLLARACGHRRLGDFCLDDLTTWKREIAHLSGAAYAGVS